MLGKSAEGQTLRNSNNQIGYVRPARLPLALPSPAHHNHSPAPGRRRFRLFPRDVRRHFPQFPLGLRRQIAGPPQPKANYEYLTHVVDIDHVDRKVVDD